MGNLTHNFIFLSGYASSRTIHAGLWRQYMIEHSSFNKIVGSTVGNYRLERLLERNKLGPLFVASTPNSARQYFLRILDIPSDLAAEARLVYLGRFQQEANQIAGLHHAAILPLLDYGNHQGMPYLVFLYNPTISPLRAYLTQQGPIDALTVSRYIDQIAAALEYAHSHAVLHRNLTTDNIMIESILPQPPRLLVANFGVMHMLELSRQDGEGFRAYGSSESSAPEQLLGKPVDTYTDTYALGAVLYRMLTGQRVFTGNSYEEVMQKHIQAPVPAFSTWIRNVPPSLDGFMATALAKEPTHRFRQPLALANAYHHIVAPNDTARPPLTVATPAVVAPPVITPPTVMRSSTPRRLAQRGTLSRRRVLISLAAGTGVVAAVTVVAIFGSHFLSGTASPTTTTGHTTTTASGTSTTTGTTSTSNTPAGHTGTVLAHTTDIPINGSKTFPIANQSNPGIIVHLTDSTFVAFDSTCTHAGCAVNYNSQDKLLECPCHQAAFDPAKNAAVVQGPAQTPLAPIHIVVNSDGTITSG